VIGTQADDEWAVTFGTARRGLGGAPAHQALLAVPNVTAHPSTASVRTLYHSMWHYNCLLESKGLMQTAMLHDNIMATDTQIAHSDCTVLNSVAGCYSQGRGQSIQGQELDNWCARILDDKDDNNTYSMQ